MSDVYLEVLEGERTTRVALGSSPLLIGHDSACDLVIAASWIAARHTRLELVAGAHHVVAEPGAAVLLGGARVTDAVLHDGDVIRLPDPSTAGLVTLIYRNPDAPRIAPIQHFATPPGTALLTIGRSGTDIVLDQPLVCRHHADLLWEHDHHVLRDRDSENGTWVNGRPVAGHQRLLPGDVVQIGTFRLTYDGDSLDSFDQRGAIRIDAAAIERHVGDKVILNPTTISIEPCEFVAIVGASGSGKSTLLTALCGFARANTGKVAINGDDLYAGYDAYRSIIGFVPQDDILHPSLVVSRALHFAARLRLPADTAPAELAARVASVLEAVDMTDHATKRIDQLSGGQRKRVSIACELLADPPLLFLDEPTSGLDPGLERKLMFTLRRLADGGRTIILVTHATANIRMCDHIAFLVEGKLAYFGPPTQAFGYFGVDDFADIYAKTDEPSCGARWEDRYRSSLQHQKYAIERPARAPASSSPQRRPTSGMRKRDALFTRGRQLAVLCRRYFELLRSDRKNLALLLLQAPVIGLLLMLVSQSDALVSSRLEAKKLTFMLATTGVWFGVINSAREICKEVSVLRREQLAGVRTSPYLASKFVVLFGVVLVQSALLLGVVAIGVKLPSDGIVLPAPLELYLTIALSGLAGIALGLCVSAVSSNPDKATSFIPIVLVPQVLFAGIMFDLRGITQLLSHAVSSRAAVDALSATVNTNALYVPRNLLPPDPHYAHTASILLAAWGTILAQTLVFSFVAWVAIERRRRR
ncbi:MAG: ATP-binding cassette domain-containing protein [Kofleriaceae bacterium]